MQTAGNQPLERCVGRSPTLNLTFSLAPRLRSPMGAIPSLRGTLWPIPCLAGRQDAGEHSKNRANLIGSGGIMLSTLAPDRFRPT